MCYIYDTNMFYGQTTCIDDNYYIYMYSVYYMHMVSSYYTRVI